MSLNQSRPCWIWLRGSAPPVWLPLIFTVPWVFWIGREYGSGPYVSYGVWISAIIVATCVGATLAARSSMRRSIPLLSRWVLVFASMFVFVCGSSFLLDCKLKELESRTFELRFLSSIASAVLESIGLECHSSEGILYVSHPEGLVGITPTFEKCAARVTALWCYSYVAVAWLLHGRRAWISILVSVIVSVIGVTGWFVIGLCFLTGIKDILASSYPSKISYLWNPYFVVLYLALLSLGAHAISVALKLSTRLGGKLRARSRSGVLITVSSAVILTGSILLQVGFITPGMPRSGRILIDDLHSEYWEQSARRLSIDWFGDFSTYNYNALAQHLGQYFQVSINVNVSLAEPRILDECDVLILKTPTRPYSDLEIRAVRKFVEKGGGLLLIGDHTNLLWMGANLNSLIRETGLNFRYDMLARASDGGFNEYVASNILPIHPALEGVPELEWMTSCTIDPGPKGRVIMAVPDAVRHPNDYGNSSYFGPLGHDPRYEVGNHVVMAEVPLGRGTVVAVADSTPFSTFSYYMYSHDQLILSTVNRLNRSEYGGEGIRILLGISSLLAVSVLLLSLNAAGLYLLPWLCIGGMMGWLGGFKLQEALVQKSFKVPERHSRPPLVTFLHGGTWSAYPPTLGGVGDTPSEAVFDTLYCIPVKLGWESRLVRNRVEAFRGSSSAVVIVNPTVDEESTNVDAAVSYVSNGGTLVILDRIQHHEGSISSQYLSAFGIALTTHHRREGVSWQVSGMQMLGKPEGDLTAWVKKAGKGQVAFVYESDMLSRAGIGHNFTYPGSAEESRIKFFARLLKDDLHLGRPVQPNYKIIE